ncbi:MAG: hypothetical protein PHV30_08255, partial [Candidatus Margulisbacteria bacterium]|nr:hypothetical protein [Candidatus Margulisiibacteriota bacterium]
RLKLKEIAKKQKEFNIHKLRVGQIITTDQLAASKPEAQAGPEVKPPAVAPQPKEPLAESPQVTPIPAVPIQPPVLQPKTPPIETPISPAPAAPPAPSPAPERPQPAAAAEKPATPQPDTEKIAQATTTILDLMKNFEFNKALDELKKNEVLLKATYEIIKKDICEEQMKYFQTKKQEIETLLLPENITQENVSKANKLLDEIKVNLSRKQNDELKALITTKETELKQKQKDQLPVKPEAALLPAPLVAPPEKREESPKTPRKEGKKMNKGTNQPVNNPETSVPPLTTPPVKKQGKTLFQTLMEAMDKDE